MLFHYRNMDPHPYFKLIGIEPGRVFTPRFGMIDFSLPVSYDTLQALYDSGFPYLKLTPAGKAALSPAEPAFSSTAIQSFDLPVLVPPATTAKPDSKKSKHR